MPAAQPLPVPFEDALRERRTWRRFGRTPVPLEALATLLRLTWGVQHRACDDQGRGLVLKTSPSGGATHPGEVYVAAFNVGSLARGVYHYDAARHLLTRVRALARDAMPLRYLPGQPWYRGAAAVMLMTAVLARERWKYASPRAYRALLIDAGHLCQTFCLTATALRLAPFCSMALADSTVERDAGIDGSTEIAVYAAGVGMRPGDGRLTTAS